MAWDNNRPNHVPARIREACLERDGNRCTQIQRDMQRCPETTDLEAAHLTRWTPGETTTVNMVRTLCRWHHNRETQREASEARAKAKKRRPETIHPNETHPALR